MTDQQFDIIIIGGGTAGCVLASRLSAVPHLGILLLEAGSDRNDDPRVQTPLPSRQMFGDSSYDWNLETEPQVHLNGRVIQQTRGRMVGGSSAINSHSLVFSNREMHDTWARMVADERWSWEQMKDCYARFHEDLQSSMPANKVRISTETEASKPIQASLPQQLNQLQRAWEDVFESLCMKSKSDGASGNCFGGFTTTNAIDSRPGKGERSHAGNAYLKPALSRLNLVVVTEALVERIEFETVPTLGSKLLTATGVTYRKDGQKIFARAKREVMLCAGVFGSPQLLEVSGVGRRKVLNNAGIECILDLPGVGENLQDHLNFGPSVEVCSDIETLDAAARDPTVMDSYREQYLNNRSGPFSEGAAYSFAFWPLQMFNTPSDEADLNRLLDTHLNQKQVDSRHKREDFIKRMILSPDEGSATVFMTRRQRYTSVGDVADGNYMTIIAMLSHPFSRGSSHVVTASSEAHPKIDCAYLSHPLDEEILARHCLQIEHLLKQPVYAPIIRADGKRLPRGYVRPFETLDEIKSAIRKFGATNYHPCGTCAMTSIEDEGVVDGSLKVYGTGNLRVCDASIFPIIPRGNILTTVYAVAEKAAEMLLKDYT